MPTFAELVPAFLDDLFRAYPVLATALGNHDHDGTWSEPSDAGSAARVALADRWRAAFSALPDGELSRDDVIDREIILGQLAATRFAETALRAEAWDPLETVFSVGDGIHLLLAREHAPLATRLASAAGRLEGLPDHLAAVAERLGGDPARPASRLHVETAIRDLPGLGELLDEALALAAAADQDGALGALRGRLDAAVGAARSAVETFTRHLETAILPVASGEGRLGPELYAAKLRHTLQLDITPDQLEERARRELEAVRAEMVRIARSWWSAIRPGEPVPSDDVAVVRGALDHVGAVHRTSADLLEHCRAELARIEAFCREQDVIGLADEPLAIEWTPPFLRAFAGAMLMAPGPLDRGLRSYFYVTPTPEDWTAEQVESHLREDNDRALTLLVIHEAVPGHYLQGVYANRSASLVRAAFESGAFAEGWAVYVTQVMMDRGFAEGDPGLLLSHWKLYLRCITNALIDVGIHARGMTRDEALELMVEGGFQEPAEAEQKYERARLSSTQLAEYFVGSMAMWDLEDEARRRAAVASGDPRGRAAVPAPRVVGGYGPTPGFRPREHLERVIAFGGPPFPLLRRLVLGD